MTHDDDLQTRLRRLCRRDVLDGWRKLEGELTRDRALDPQVQHTWDIAPLNARRHIPWERGRRVLWLAQAIGVPPHQHGFDLTGLSLKLSLRWWADEAEIFLNGEFLRGGDLFDCFGRVTLSELVRPGEVFHVALKLRSPNHDDGALVTSELIYETDGIDPNFLADELDVCAAFYSSQFNLKYHDYNSIIKWKSIDTKPQNFHASLVEVHHRLKHDYPEPPATLALMGHAHLDMAWLWDVPDTWEAAQRTFASVLALQQDFPELVFSHSSAALYEWVETHRPDLFLEICDRVKAGTWEVAAGLWVEPELNLISGESIVRQILYAQQYVRSRFQQTVRVAWLPDSFGFCWQLPQLLKLGQIEYFATQKLRWNDTTEFPHDLFWWESPDGTRILSWMSSPIGQTVEPTQMAAYAADWTAKTGQPEALWLPGVGDHGGGPTRDMLEVARRWRQSPQFPDLQFSTATAYFDRLQTRVTSQDRELPVWRDELYLEFHRGCYTTQGDRKLANRRGEQRLYQAELFASLAGKVAGFPYPHAELTAAWKGLLFDQFHDILPGSSIPEVFAAANRTSAALLKTATAIREAAIAVLTQQIPQPPPPHPEAVPLFVVNSLNWRRSQLVSFPIPETQHTWQLCDFAGHPVSLERHDSQLYFHATAVPGIGCRGYWLYPSSDGEGWDENLGDRPFVLENDRLRVDIDPKTGNLQQVFSKDLQRNILEPGRGNVLQAFGDRGQYWDAWNIDPDYEQHWLEPLALSEIKWQCCGQLRQVVRVVRRFRSSTFVQEYCLNYDSDWLQIDSWVDWQEQYVFVKAAFDFCFEAEDAHYEIPCGAIARPTRPKTPAEAAKWEVPAMHWADLSTAETAEFGVSLLNDCKYGYDAKPRQLRLSLLRSPQWPNPEGDRGEHRFSYALYPHRGDWKVGDTVRRGYELNQPLLLHRGTPANERSEIAGNPETETCWLSLADDSFVLMALKQAERTESDGSPTWILRGYESRGEATQFEIDPGTNGEKTWTVLSRVDGLETAMAGGREVSPWQVASFRLM